ncbi:MAG: ATP-binding protein, partial [Verrucomicrobium sp.]
MIEFFRKLFDTSDFPARWHCGYWTDGHGWLHIISDVAIFGAYAAIPISIATFVLTKRRDIVFPKLYWLFATFILSCGLTHLVEATIFWHPWYRFSGVMKLLTAVVSWTTVFALIKILPSALNLPGIARLNDQLVAEINERKASEAAQRNASARLALAMEHSDLGDWSWEASTNHCTFSRRAAEILGLPQGQPQSRDTLRTHIHPEDRERSRVLVEDSISTRQSYSNEYRVIRPRDGHLVWVSAKGRGIYDARGSITSIIGTIADVTERKMLDQERERLLANESEARAEAERANRIKDEFLATLSHELRTPLNAILGWATMLRAEGVQSAELDTGLAVIERNTLLQSQLIDDLLDMSRIISGKIILDSKRIDLHQIALQSVTTVKLLADEKGVALLPPAQTSPIYVEGDGVRIQQIIWNLLTNAVKFTPSGGAIKVSLLCGQDHAELSITDTGSGISPEFLPHAFDRFRQSDSSTTRKHGGLGLGLSIVKTLTELHGGTVQASSPGLGKGCTFKVVLPLSQTKSATNGGELFAPASVSPPSSADLTGTQILVVDDAQDSLDLMTHILQGRGARVTAVKSASAALDQLEHCLFHVMVSDIGMPEMDGFDLITQARQRDGEHGGHIPAIAVTAFARPEDR